MLVNRCAVRDSLDPHKLYKLCTNLSVVHFGVRKWMGSPTPVGGGWGWSWPLGLPSWPNQGTV